MKHVRVVSSLIALLLLLGGSGVVYANYTQKQLYQAGIYYFDIDGGSSSCGDASLVGGDNETKIWNFFKGQGLDDMHTAGILGNLASETAHTWNPEIIQGGGTTQDPSTVTGSTGWGLVQWTPGSKALDVAKAFKITTPIYDLSTQLNMVWDQMQPGSAYAPSSHWSLDDYKATTTLADAANYFNSNFEISADTSNARATNAQQELEKYQGGGGANSTGSSSCGPVDCTSPAGSAKILCAAKKYEGIYYEWAGGHQGRDAFISGCSDPTNPSNNQAHGAPIDANGLSGNPSPCAIDCSGLVSMAVDDAFGQKFDWTVADIVADSTNWQKININQAQPGDVVTEGTEHVEIFVSLSGSTLTTFGSHETGTKTGQATTSPDKYDGVYHYIGPGSS